MPSIRITGTGKRRNKNQIKVMVDDEILIDHLFPHLVGKPIYQFMYDADRNAMKFVGQHRTRKFHKGIGNYVKVSYIIGWTESTWLPSYAAGWYKPRKSLYLVDSNWRSYRIDAYNLNATMLDDIAPIFEKPYSLVTTTSRMGDYKVSLVPFGIYRGNLMLVEEDVLKGCISYRKPKDIVGMKNQYREVRIGRQEFKEWLRDYVKGLPKREDLY